VNRCSALSVLLVVQPEGHGRCLRQLFQRGRIKNDSPVRPAKGDILYAELHGAMVRVRFVPFGMVAPGGATINVVHCCSPNGCPRSVEITLDHRPEGGYTLVQGCCCGKGYEESKMVRNVWGHMAAGDFPTDGNGTQPR
jgi:hypothetical protein